MAKNPGVFAQLVSQDSSVTALQVFAKPRVLPTFCILLAAIFGIPTLIISVDLDTRIVQLLLYVFFICVFHQLEFVWSLTFERNKASFDSFLLNQNWPDYQRALAVAVIEFIVESFLFPSLKTSKICVFVSCVGAVVACGGQIIRTWAMLTAGMAFSHQIASTRRNEHTLVTNGIYTYMRHPSYVGWFYWSIGTVVLLVNPVTSILYAYIVWRFFASRIPYEEATLMEMFPTTYEAYARKTPVGIPGIQGHVQLQGPPPPLIKRLVSTMKPE